MINMQGNFNQNGKIPNLIPSNQVEEMTDQQDMMTEILNIAKIKEGFYIGDRISAISLDVIIQFKITHIINATGNQIINQWESIGVSYLTLNWTEVPNQILFDKEDEIANKIVEFVDNSYLGNGEGLLAHSFKGQDRACIVALIYLMKKYKWSLKKSIEYLKSKKQDVEIPIYFYMQLQNFESRLKIKGEFTKDIPWEFGNLINTEEKLLRNTYINGLKPEIINFNLNKFKDNKRHIVWADINPFKKLPIEIVNSENDLFFKKDIRSITLHQSIKPLKGYINEAKNNMNRNNNLIIKNNIFISNHNNINNDKNLNNYKIISNKEEFKNNYENKFNRENNINSYNNIFQQKENMKNLQLRDNNPNSNINNIQNNYNFIKNNFFQDNKDINFIATGKFINQNNRNNLYNMNNNVNNRINNNGNNNLTNNMNVRINNNIPNNMNARIKNNIPNNKNNRINNNIPNNMNLRINNNIPNNINPRINSNIPNNINPRINNNIPNNLKENNQYKSLNEITKRKVLLLKYF